MILEQLGKKLLFFDGGMGTLLQEKGLKPGELPETWNLNHPEDIIGRTVVIHDMADDFRSQPSGGSGKKIACGEIKEVGM